MDILTDDTMLTEGIGYILLANGTGYIDWRYCLYWLRVLDVLTDDAGYIVCEYYVYWGYWLYEQKIFVIFISFSV
jgi:hypothetical protein